MAELASLLTPLSRDGPETKEARGKKRLQVPPAWAPFPSQLPKIV